MKHSLAGQVAVVTYGAGELGRGVCQALGEAGARLAIGDPREGAAVAMAADLKAQGIDTRGWQTNPRQVKSLETLVTGAVGAYGRLDIMVNLHSVPAGAPAEQLPFPEFSAVVSANLTQTFFGCQYAAKRMVEQSRLPGSLYKGCLVNVTSVTGELAVAGHAALGAAMAGVTALTKVLATEWRADAVRVVAVGAGLTEDLLATALALPGAMRRVSAGALTDGYQIGRVVVALAADEASHIVGSVVYADGGWLADGYWQEGDRA